MIRKLSKRFVSYLPAFVFTLAYLLFQYLVPNVSITVSPLQTLRAVITFFIVLIVLAFFISRVIKDHIKAGLVLWIITELFLFSQTFFIFSGIVSVTTILVWIILRLIRKKTIGFDYLSFLLSNLGLGLIIIIMILDHIPLGLYLKGLPTIEEPPKQELVISEPSPDIYYIVLDAYARSDVLDNLFGFDNSEFTGYLSDKGFIIPINNHSNYGTSELSEAATLNLQYIQTLMPEAEGWPHWWLLSPLLENSSVKTMLENAGYQSISIEVDYEVINIKNVDEQFRPYSIRLNTFEKYLIQTSPIRVFAPFLSKFTLVNTYSSHREMVNYSFATLSVIPELESPKFIYSHITSPHPPFVFDKNGQPIDPSYEYSFRDGIDFPEPMEKYKMGYIGQLQYINQQLITTIDSILENSENPPIIIIMSDHGSRLYSNFSNPEANCMSESFSNFMALHLPGMKMGDVPSDITSVNVFRFIFDNYFQTEFGLLDNRYYFFSDEGGLYRFKDVGQSINSECDFSP